MNLRIFTSALVLLLLLVGHASAEGPQPVRIRVLTYNIASGAGIQLDLARTAKVIQDQKPDLVALQEVDNNTRRHPVDQATELGRLTGMHFAFGKALDYQGGHYGVAILSRFPFIETNNHALAARQGHEPRAALEARVRIGDSGPEVVFVGTHLDHTNDPTDRNAQAHQINQWFAAKSAVPTILAGDFNATSESEAYRILEQHWTDATTTDKQGTWPAVAPKMKIDFIWCRPADRFRVVEAHVIDDRVASDHRPVLAVLELLL